MDVHLFVVYGYFTVKIQIMALGGSILAKTGYVEGQALPQNGQDSPETGTDDDVLGDVEILKAYQDLLLLLALL